jgi:hypothetical protein
VFVFTEEYRMTLSTHMQFGRESEIAANDVGQPKFRLIDAQNAEELYVLLGSLHIPIESDGLIAEAEHYVNRSELRPVLLRTLARISDRTIPEHAEFEYVRRHLEYTHTTPTTRRIAQQ